MARKLKYTYDPIDLIELVEQRPCIWDQTSDDFKDRVKKARAWKEIYNYLVDDYEYLGEEDQLAAGRAINEKWKHIRDAFKHSLKKRSGDRGQKKYIYSDQLQFLLKIKDETASSNDDATIRQSEDEEMSSSYPSPQPFVAILEPGPSTPRKRMKTETNDTTIMNALEAVSQQPLIDEDMAFFMSIAPSVKQFTEDEKLDFRMGVLNLIKQIKGKRRISCAPIGERIN